MVIKEMKMHMASPEACFQAATAEECIDQIHRWMPPTSPFCRLLLRDAIENLCLDTLTSESQQQFSDLGPVNLFAMVSGKLATVQRACLAGLLTRLMSQLSTI